MTVDTILEELREQPREEEGLKKHMGSYRTRDVDQYINKMRDRMRKMESVYQERLEEMRTNLLGMTRERDVQAVRISEMEARLKDIPRLCQQYLKDQELVAMPREQYRQIESIDPKEYEQLAAYKAKSQSMEQVNRQLIAELDKARAAGKENREDAARLQKLAMQAQAQTELIEQQKTQLQMQTELVQQKQEQLESMDALCRNQSAQLAQVQSKYQEIEQEHRHLQEISRLLAGEKDCLEKEVLKQKDIWETERKFFISRFNRILNGQKQYMEHLRESISASILQMEKINGADFLNLPDSGNQDG